jgi:hypothetical protein
VTPLVHMLPVIRGAAAVNDCRGPALQVLGQMLAHLQGETPAQPRPSICALCFTDVIYLPWARTWCLSVCSPVQGGAPKAFPSLALWKRLLTPHWPQLRQQHQAMQTTHSPQLRQQHQAMQTRLCSKTSRYSKTCSKTCRPLLCRQVSEDDAND